MIGSFKAEWRKLRKRPAVLTMAGLLLALVVLIGYAISYLTYTQPAAPSTGRRLAGVAFLALYLMVVGGLAAAVVRRRDVV